uniref:uncharacterized protein LOC118543012 isoform X2 n=1 Tax=Halichoerus grypus TaxID=9711 RepID=UPI0016592553|nr:uncharacterized protein LOC118543012 isoform X2 [Halichoerus grypus]
MATHPTCTPAEERGGRGKNSPYCLYSFCQKSIIRRTLQPQARELVSVEAPPRLVSCILPRLLQLGHWPGDGQRPCCPEDGRNETSLPCCNVSFLFIFLVPSLRELKGVEMECSDCPDIMLCPPSTRMAAWGLSPGVGRCKLGEGRAPKGGWGQKTRTSHRDAQRGPSHCSAFLPAPASGEQEGGWLTTSYSNSSQLKHQTHLPSLLTGVPIHVDVEGALGGGAGLETLGPPGTESTITRTPGATVVMGAELVLW